MSATHRIPDYSEKDETETEADRVRVWRESEFMRMGYSQAEAFYLAFSEADLHFVARLLAEGCPRNVAARIAS